MSVKFSIPDPISSLEHSHYFQWHLFSLPRNLGYDISLTRFSFVLASPGELEYVARIVSENQLSLSAQ